MCCWNIVQSNHFWLSIYNWNGPIILWKTNPIHISPYYKCCFDYCFIWFLLIPVVIHTQVFERTEMWSKDYQSNLICMRPQYWPPMGRLVSEYPFHDAQINALLTDTCFITIERDISIRISMGYWYWNATKMYLVHHACRDFVFNTTAGYCFTNLMTRI